MHTFLYWLQSVFLLVNLNLFLLNISLDQKLILKLLDPLFFLLLAHFHQAFVSFNFRLYVLVCLFNHIHVWVKSVHIVIKWIVLLFSFDEGCHNLFVWLESCLLLDLVKRILNDLNVSDVLVHQRLLFLVVLGPFLEPLFNQLGRRFIFVILFALTIDSRRSVLVLHRSSHSLALRICLLKLRL